MRSGPPLQLPPVRKCDGNLAATNAVSRRQSCVITSSPWMVKNAPAMPRAVARTPLASVDTRTIVRLTQRLHSRSGNRLLRMRAVRGESDVQQTEIVLFDVRRRIRGHSV